MKARKVHYCGKDNSHTPCGLSFWGSIVTQCKKDATCKNCKRKLKKP